VIGKMTIPTVNTNIQEVTITGWFKQEGEKVRKGESIVEVTTEKAAVELESPFTGTVRRILAREKSVLPVGYVIALIGDPRDPLPDVSGRNRKLLDKRLRPAAAASRPAPAAPAAEAGRVRATPAARRLAKEKGVDLAALSASLHLDLVRENDILTYLEKGS
jgi:pyruvate/2-oxoglutarate dehydrogenase complex dihydrolipoamide acyltransferase (E2) component